MCAWRVKKDESKSQILLDYSSLGEGESQAGQVCPSCQGGASKERTLSVTRRGGSLLYNCHRASCTFHGAIALTGKFGDGQSTNKGTTSYPRIKSQPLDKTTYKFLADKFGIEEEDLSIAGLRWSGDGDGPLARRVCYPIYAPNLEERGTSYRSYEGKEPKAIIELRSPDEIATSWYKWKRKSSTLVVVEDPVSAIKIAPFVHSLALLGTHISDAKADEIAAEKYVNVYIMLDNDATDQAIKHQLKYRNKIKGLQVIGLGPKDIKDMDKDEFDDFLLKYIL